MISHVSIYFSAVQIFDIPYVFICTIKFLHSTKVTFPAGPASSRCRALEGKSGDCKGKGPCLKGERGLGKEESETILGKIGSRLSRLP